eukprot:567426-Lingulodinium_polyedra.AAC.1
MAAFAEREELGRDVAAVEGLQLRSRRWLVLRAASLQCSDRAAGVHHGALVRVGPAVAPGVV